MRNGPLLIRVGLPPMRNGPLLIRVGLPPMRNCSFLIGVGLPPMRNGPLLIRVGLPPMRNCSFLIGVELPLSRNWMIMRLSGQGSNPSALRAIAVYGIDVAGCELPVLRRRFRRTADEWSPGERKYARVCEPCFWWP